MILELSIPINSYLFQALSFVSTISLALFEECAQLTVHCLDGNGTVMPQVHTDTLCVTYPFRYVQDKKFQLPFF